MVNTNACSNFEFCDAPLCPLDDSLKSRVWYADEDICKSRVHGKHRWINKQRSIRRRRTKSWFERPVSYDDLVQASRPKKLTEAQRQILAERMAENRQKNKTVPKYVSF